MIQCRECGRFFREKHNQLYCSHECRLKHKARNSALLRAKKALEQRKKDAAQDAWLPPAPWAEEGDDGMIYGNMVTL